MKKNSSAIQLYTREYFQDIDQLRSWISSKQLGLPVWGTHAVRYLEQLWYEVTCGEAILVNNPPWRRIFLIRVFVQDSFIPVSHSLEAKKQLACYTSALEKVRYDETFHEAIVRCLNKSIGASIDQIEVLEVPSRLCCIDTTSQEIPGFGTRYFVYSVFVKVNNSTFAP